jgi:hypothetical protein
MRQLSLAITILSLAVAARAADPPRSEYFWQPRDLRGATSFSGTLANGSSSSFDQKARTSTDLSSQTYTENIAVSFGMTDEWALKIPLQYIAQTDLSRSPDGTENVLKSRGLSDPTATLSNTTRFGRFALHYGSTFRISLGPILQRTEAAIGNTSVGGLQLTPYIGLSLSIGRSDFLGFKLSYQYNGDRVRLNQGGSDSSLVGGDITTASAFYELHLSRFYVSPIVTAAFIEGQTTTTQGVANVSDVRTTQTYAFSSGYYLTKDTALSLSVSLATDQEYKSGNTVNSGGSSVQYTLGLRVEI